MLSGSFKLSHAVIGAALRKTNGSQIAGLPLVIDSAQGCQQAVQVDDMRHAVADLRISFSVFHIDSIIEARHYD